MQTEFEVGDKVRFNDYWMEDWGKFNPKNEPMIVTDIETYWGGEAFISVERPDWRVQESLFSSRFELVEETKIEEEKLSQYAVFVVGKQSPSKLNHTLESAIKEAERLCSKENKKAYIVRLVWVQSPKVVSEFTSL